MITLTERQYAKSMAQVADAERAAAERRDGRSNWRTGPTRPSKSRQPRRPRPMQARVLAALESRSMTREEIGDVIDRGRETTNTLLRSMTENGSIEQIGEGPERRYQLAAEMGEGG